MVASAPLILKMAMPPVPIGVAIAAIVSCSFIHILHLKSRGSLVLVDVLYQILNDSRKFGVLDILLDEERFFARLFEVLQNPPSWKQIFSNYKLEFWRNYPFAFHMGDARVSLRNALLLEDGSVDIGGRVIYNLRECGV